MQNGPVTLEDTLAVSHIAKLLLVYDPAIRFFNVYPSELKAYIHVKNCTRIFKADLLIMAQTGKQSILQ